MILDYTIDKYNNEEIIPTFDYLKKYKKEVIISIINEHFNEEDKLNLLRNKEFIEVMPSFLLELMLNNMNFTSVFNMLQNKELLNKIKNINIKLTPKDNLFVKDCLSQVDFINIIDENMLKNMLINNSKDEVINYLNTKYILDKLSVDTIIDIALIKKINLVTEFNYINKLNKTQLIKYIDEMYKTRLDYTLIDNDYVKKELFNISNEDFQEVIYLYDFITTKENHNIKDLKHDVSSFKSLYSAYKLIGFDNIFNIVSKNKIDFNDLFNTFKYIDLGSINDLKTKFANKNYKKVLNHKYDNLILSFGTIINNLEKEDVKKDLYEIEKDLLNKYSINNLDNKDIAKDILNNDYNYNLEELVTTLKEKYKLLNNKTVINNINDHIDNISYELEVDKSKLINLSNFDNNSFAIKVNKDNHTAYLYGKKINNIIYLRDELPFKISETIINNILNTNKDIDYIIINSKQNDLNAIKVSSNYYINNNNLNNIYIMYKKPIIELDITRNKKKIK